MTREEVVKKILADFDDDIMLNVLKKRMAIASLPDGWGGHGGYSFLLAYRSTETGEVDEELICYLYADNDGKHGDCSESFGKDVVAKFDIDWNAGTAKGPWYSKIPGINYFIEGKEMTREEIIKKVSDERNEEFEMFGYENQPVAAALPADYGAPHNGVKFLLGSKSLKTGKVSEDWVFFSYANSKGELNRWPGPPLHKDVVAKFDIDWDAGTAKLKE